MRLTDNELTDFVVELRHVDLHLLAVKPVVLAELANGPDLAELPALGEALIDLDGPPPGGAPVHDHPVVDEVRHRSDHLCEQRHRYNPKHKEA